MIDYSILKYYARLKESLALSDLVINHSILIHEKVLKSKFGKGLDPYVVASACVYITSRHHDSPRNLKQVNIAGSIARKDIARCYRLLVRNHREIGFVKPFSHRSRLSFDNLKWKNDQNRKDEVSEDIIYDCRFCGYKTKHKEVIFLHQYLRKKYGYGKESNS